MPVKEIDTEQRREKEKERSAPLPGGPSVASAICLMVTILPPTAPLPPSAARASLTRRLTSAMSNASVVRSAHMAVSAVAVGPNPAGAVTEGRASMPAPTVDPVMRAMAPKMDPAAEAPALAGSGDCAEASGRRGQLKRRGRSRGAR